MNNLQNNINIENYIIFKELKSLFSTENICYKISNKGLREIKNLMHKKLLDINFHTPEYIGESYYVEFEFIIDLQNEEATIYYLNISKELFEQLIIL